MSANPTSEKVNKGQRYNYNRPKILVNVIIWFFVSVLFSLLPLLIKVFTFMNRGKTVTLMDIGSRGEFYLIAAALSPIAIIQIISGSRNWFTAKVISVVGCLVTLGISCAIYGDMSAAIVSKGYYNLYLVTYWSVPLFVLGVVSGAGCVAFAEV
jgi:hypothetical protein